MPVDIDSTVDLDVYDPQDDGEETTTLTEYDLVSTPNDFNVLTITSFLESGYVKIPRYQRNYVWDKARASKLIESLILGLPVPQVFLYEEGKNAFQIIDGQQRLMSIYFFKKGRFPKKNVRPLLRNFWGERGAIPADVLFNDEYFENFSLRLHTGSNPLNNLNYETLGDRQGQLDMRTIRNVIIKQVSPAGRSAVYEIFNRLNTTGVNLSAQEIRVSLAASPFMDRLFWLNENAEWRRVLGSEVLDPRLRDLEILFRALAMADASIDYRPSMVRFLNEFADQTKSLDESTANREFDVLREFISQVDSAGREPLLVSGRFSVPVFEALFAGYARALRNGGNHETITSIDLATITSDQNFVAAASDKTTDKRNVDARIAISTSYFLGN